MIAVVVMYSLVGEAIKQWPKFKGGAAFYVM